MSGTRPCQFLGILPAYVKSAGNGRFGRSQVLETASWKPSITFTDRITCVGFGVVAFSARTNGQSWRKSNYMGLDIAKGKEVGLLEACSWRDNLLTILLICWLLLIVRSPCCYVSCSLLVAIDNFAFPLTESIACL